MFLMWIGFLALFDHLFWQLKIVDRVKKNDVLQSITFELDKLFNSSRPIVELR